MRLQHRSFISFSGLAFLLALSLAVIHCKKDTDPVLTLGKLQLTPQEALINQPTQIAASIKVLPGLKVGDTVTLVKILPNGNSTHVTYLLDNGDLAGSGDEIKGDRVYSAKFTLNETAEGIVKFKAHTRTKNETPLDISSNIFSFNVFADLKPGEMKTLFAVQQSAANQLSTYLGGNQSNAANAINQLVAWLKTKPEIQTVEQSGLTNIEITYKSGLKGGLIIDVLDADGLCDTRGGFPVQQRGSVYDRSKTPAIPLQLQTRGTNFPENKSAHAFDPNTIGNRNVFIFAAFEAAWRNNERPHIINILDSLACGDFQVNWVTDQQATIASLYDITSYGVVVFATHGSGGKSIVTGEIADTLLPAYQLYKPMMRGDNPKLGISTNLQISLTGQVSVKANVYKIYHPFISALAGEFPQSIILNNSCQSDKTPALRQAFLDKGAKTYYGHSESTYGPFCVRVSRDVFITLAKNGKTTGEVASINTTYNVSPFPVFKIRGSTTMKFALSLVNNNFEDGYLGWTRNGDGRIISQLGFINPPGGNYMGIISSGLGYTTATGRMSQSFNIPANATALRVKWNFLSEEFLEYIGSMFQDKFEIVLITENAGEVVLLSKTIDGIAAQFGASPPTPENPDGIPGELISVSPGIVFDRGGVYMTGWQSSTFDISAYKGKCVTLVLRCTDVGDSIYDTAILIDDIVVN